MKDKEWQCAVPFLSIMNEKFLKTLEYDKILKTLEHFASSELGKNKVRKLRPTSDFSAVRASLIETNDAAARIYRHGNISFSGAKDIRDTLLRLEVGSTIGIGEFLKIGAILDTAKRAIAYNDVEDSISGRFVSLAECDELNVEIKRCIISEEEISDNASQKLREIRRELRLMDDRIHSEINKVLNAHRAHLQEAVITTRNDRYCLPVKAEYRSSIPGMIHDQSSTGATVFIEPMSVVKLNNEERELELEEQREIEAILARLSILAAGYTGMLREDIELLSELDFIMAKGEYAKDIRAIMPIMNHKGIIDIKQGRHPLIDPSKVVPIDINLGREFDLVVVTGPNTGGKTVSMKTVGLLSLMACSGLMVPAREGTMLSVFDDVFADIGDEQSIEQSLSTFSSHMVRIVDILKNVTSHSLVLFDELGAGTDPTEGAALAVSILDYLHQKNIRCMATTHYSEMKIYALTTEGVCNASCEFDVTTLKPTYRLLMGVPGKSNAFAISKRLGLMDFIIDDAKKRLDGESVRFEDVIGELVSDKASIERDKEETLRYKEEIKRLQESLSKKNENIDKRREDIIRKANEEARQIIASAKETADVAIRNINKYGKSTKELEEERARLRDSLNDVHDKLAIKNEKKKSKTKPSDIKEGMRVHVISFNQDATVVSKPNEKGEVYIQMGILHTQVKANDLEIIEEAKTESAKQKSGSGKIKMNKGITVSSEINLIGMTRDEAVMELDKYLDDAILSSLATVRIVHGKGSGILREAVASELRKNKHVKSFRLGVYGEGETGVTIVEFK